METPIWSKSQLSLNAIQKFGSLNQIVKKKVNQSYLPLLSFATTHVDLPQNGVKSHDLPGSTVAHRVDAKHIPGKSINSIQTKTGKTTISLGVFFFSSSYVDIECN